MNDKIEFILTKEYKKFEEFCNSCKDYRYIGLCYGAPGIGKTLSANRYSDWNKLKQYYDLNLQNFINNRKLIAIPDRILECDTIVETVSATNTPIRIEKSIFYNAKMLKFIQKSNITEEYHKVFDISDEEKFSAVKLVIIDEADHLKYSSIEQLRNIYDRF